MNLKELKERLKKKQQQYQKADNRDWKKRLHNIEIELIKSQIKTAEIKEKIDRLKKQNGH